MNLIFNKTCWTFLLMSSLFAISGLSQSEPSNNRTSQQLESNINQLLTSQHLPGMVMLVKKNNKIIHHKAYGYADIEAQEPMSKDRLFRLYSMTKPITALTALQVLAEKNIKLEQPLQLIFSEFEKQSPIPLSTLMTHTSGFSDGFKINRWAGWLYLFSDIGESQTLTEFIGHLADLPLLSEPGERWRYSLSSDVQGALVEKLTGKKLSANMHSRLFSKLAMQDTSFYVEPERVNRLAPLYSNNWFGKVPNKKVNNDATHIEGAESGGGGLVSTAEDYSKFVQLLMSPGSFLNIVLGEHVDLMTSSQLPKEIPNIPERYYSNTGYSYGLGIKLKDEQYLSEGSFYWSGKGGTIFWADPKKALSVVVMMQYEGGNKILEKELIPMVYNWLEQNENTTR
jgi:CubicO group peptidase (beta-lactamase class C family)